MVLCLSSFKGFECVFFCMGFCFFFGSGRFFSKVFFVWVFLLNGVFSIQRVSFFFSKGGFFIQECF